MIKRALLISLAMMRAIAASTATVVRAVLEGGKWVLRSVAAPSTSATAAAGEDALAEVEAMTAQTEAAAAAKAAIHAELDRYQVPYIEANVDESVERAWGLAALAYLHPLEGDTPESWAILDKTAITYLRGLTHDQRQTLTLYGSKRIGEHLLCSRPIIELVKTRAQIEQIRNGTASVPTLDAVLDRGCRPGPYDGEPNFDLDDEDEDEDANDYQPRFAA